MGSGEGRDRGRYDEWRGRVDSVWGEWGGV